MRANTKKTSKSGAKSCKGNKPTPAKSTPLSDGDRVWCVDFFKGVIRGATYISDKDNDCYMRYFPLSLRSAAISLLKSSLKSELNSYRGTYLYHRGRARLYEMRIRKLQKKIKSLK